MIFASRFWIIEWDCCGSFLYFCRKNQRHLPVNVDVGRMIELTNSPSLSETPRAQSGIRRLRNHFTAYMQWANVLNLQSYNSREVRHSRSIGEAVGKWILKSEKSIVLQLVSKFPICYGTRRFITIFTRARHRSLCWAGKIRFAAAEPAFWDTFLWHCILQLVLQNDLIFPGF